MDKTELERKNERYYDVCCNYMRATQALAERSDNIAVKTGCLFVKHGNIISFGFDSKQPKLDNPFGSAALNAICKLAVSSESSAGATVFLTHAPSNKIATLLLMCNVKDVIYNELGVRKDIRDDGVTLLNENGVPTKSLSSLKPHHYYK